MIAFFLQRRVFTNLLTILLVTIGGWQFWHVRREAFPDISFDIITIGTNYPGASPEEVERLVTTPIEDTLRDVVDVDRVESYSLESRSVVVIRLREGMRRSDVSRVVNEIQQAVHRAGPLPEETDSPLVSELSHDRPLITLSVAGGTLEDRDAFAERLKDRIEELPGVARATAEGDLPREIWVEADPGRLARNRVTVGEIAAALKAENVNLSAGSVKTATQEFLVRTMGAFETHEDVGAVILRGNDERSFLRVRDVARVRETFAEPRLLARAGGLPAINLQVRKKREGDTLLLADGVKELRLRYLPEASQLGLKLLISDDWSFFVKRRLNVMKSNLIQGGFFILLALFLFLDWRLAAVAALGVPISFAAAMAVAVPLGMTVNLMSLLAFIVVLGMLDDDSVVVAENIYRHLEMGKPPLKAALDGAREVVAPVLGSVAATAAAFVPFGLVSGIMGKFLFMIPVIVVMCFAASVLEAFFILPSHVLDILPLGKPVGKPADSRWYARLVSGYRRALSWCLDHRWAFVGIAAGVLVLTAVTARLRLKMVLFPPGMIDQFFVMIELDESAPLAASDKAMGEIEKAVTALPPEDLEAVVSSVGIAGFEETVRRGTNLAQARVFLTPQERRKRPTDEIIAELRSKLKGVPGVVKLSVEKLRTGPPVGRAVQARIRGDDPRILQNVADRVKATLGALPGVSDIKDSFEGGKAELRVRVRPEEAAYAGVATAQVARHVLYAYEGGEVTKIRRPREEVIVKVKLAPEFRRGAEALQDLLVTNSRGQQVALSPLVKVERRSGPPTIEHYNFKRSVQVTADVDNVAMTSIEANARLRDLLKDLPAEFPGYDVVYGGEEERTRESMESLRRAFGVALFLDLLILATLFNSYVQPLIILLTIPIGLVGVALALMVHGEPASFMALLGTVAMTGVVVNNAIVLVDFINTRRAEGHDIREAVLSAGAIRLRPIAASSLTTLAGLFPTAYGMGGYEPFVAPMCLTLAWGLALAMPLTLFVIPMATVMVSDLRDWARRKLDRTGGRRLTEAAGFETSTRR